MINCPNCGQPVPDGQRYCGNCGTDVQAARAASAPPTASNEPQPAPYAYPQPSPYDYEMHPSAEPSLAGNRVLIVAVLILGVCCAFLCGIAFGFEGLPSVFGIGSAPAPRPTLTPSSLKLLQDLMMIVDMA